MTDNPWDVLESKQIPAGRFTITKDHVRLPNQKEIDFSYINLKPAVCVLAINDLNEVILINQYRYAVKEWKWELPAGMIELNEDPLNTAKRELLEETGYEADSWHSLGYFHPSAGSTTELFYLFAATDLKYNEKQDLEDSELIQVHSKKWDDVLNLIRNNEFRHGAGMATILRYHLKHLS